MLERLSRCKLSVLILILRAGCRKVLWALIVRVAVFWGPLYRVERKPS